MIRLKMRIPDRVWVRGVWEGKVGEGLTEHDTMGICYYRRGNPLCPEGWKNDWNGLSFINPDKATIIIPNEFT